MADATTGSRAPLLVFIHIPKTAGSTLRKVLNANEPGDRSKALTNVFKGGGGVSPGSVARLSKGQGPNLKGVALVRGHLPLGIREYLPLFMRQKARELRCFTFLREPADRTLSHYFAVREIRRGYQLPPLPPDATLEDALELGYLHDNLQTRMLCGDPEPFGEVTDEMLERAKQNLCEGLAFFGLTERFDESLVLARRRLGFRSIFYKESGRVNKKRARGADIPKKLRRAAEACNRFDIELYEYAKQLFESVPERDELEFEVEVAALRLATANGTRPMTPVPARFGGDEAAWGLLIETRAQAEKLEWELALSSTKAADALASSRALSAEMESVKRDAARLGELEQEVEQLRSAAARRASTRKRKSERGERASKNGREGTRRAREASGGEGES